MPRIHSQPLQAGLIALFLALMLMGCSSAEGPQPVLDVQVSGDTVQVNFTDGTDTRISTNQLHGWLAAKGYERPRARQLLHSMDQQAAAFNRGREAATAASESQKETVLWMARVILSETKKSEDMEYVGWVYRNRLQSQYYPDTPKQVALQPGQFSAFNEGAPRRDYYMSLDPGTESTYWRRAYRMAQYVVNAPDSLNPMVHPEKGVVAHFVMEETQRTRYGAMPHWYDEDHIHYQTAQTTYFAGLKAPRMRSGS